MDLSKGYDAMNHELFLEKLNGYCNTFLNDLFFVLKDTDVCNFANDTSTHVSDISFDVL